MNYTKKPKVILMVHTPDPKRAVSLATHAWHADNFPEDMSEISDEYADQLSTRAMTDFHSTALEYVSMTFVIKNVSRAFQQQLTRTRLAAYAIQSMRIVTKNGFATNGHYTMPPSLNDSERDVFNEMMLSIEYNYEKLIKNGVNAEDARGLLPLNTHSDISFTINFNALRHMMKQRLCVNTQHEYRQVAKQIKQQVELKMGKLFSDQFNAPCIKINKCPMRNEYCGLPLWKYSDEKNLEIYEKYVSFKKSEDNKEWLIKWVDNIPVEGIEKDG